MTPTPRIITEHVPCLCGYDLHGQPDAGTCPECGLSIATMLQKRRRHAMWSQRVANRMHFLLSLFLACGLIPNLTVAAAGRQPELFAVFQTIWLGSGAMMLVMTISLTILAAKRGQAWVGRILALYTLAAFVFAGLNFIAQLL